MGIKKQLRVKSEKLKRPKIVCLSAAKGQRRDKPKIVCLCGSVRWAEAFAEANLRESLAGSIVLSIAGCGLVGVEKGITKEQKAALDELHFRKIDLADEVLILNVAGYIGESTWNEIAYAVKKKKKIRYLEVGVNGETPGMRRRYE